MASLDPQIKLPPFFVPPSHFKMDQYISLRLMIPIIFPSGIWNRSLLLPFPGSEFWKFIRPKTHSRNSGQWSRMFNENKTEVSEFYTDYLVISTSREAWWATVLGVTRVGPNLVIKPWTPSWLPGFDNSLEWLTELTKWTHSSLNDLL